MTSLPSCDSPTADAFHKRKPLAGYLRLTVDRDGKKIGYEVQMAEINRWCGYSGHTVGHWYRDEDITAADRRVIRPEYEQMLADVAAGMWGGIVAWRLDRLVRQVYEFERCFRIIEDAGGSIISIEPMVDSSTDIGKLLMRLLVMFAEMEIATMRARAKGHRRERAEKGMYNGGGPRPFGFKGAIRDEEGKYLNVGQVGVAHEPQEVLLCQEAARRIAEEGWGWTDVIEDWTHRGVMGTQGKPFTVENLQRTLTSNRMLGLREFRVEDPETGEEMTLTSKAVWEPILDQAIVYKLRSLIKVKGPRGPKLGYLLSKTLRCSFDDRQMTGRRRERERSGVVVEVPTYLCKRPHGCGRTIDAEPTEKLIIAAVVRRLQSTPAVLVELAKASSVGTEELDAATADLDEAKTLLRDLATQFGQRKFGMEEWLAARAPLEELQASAERRIERFSRAMKVPMPSSGDRADLLAWFLKLTMTQQRILINAVVESSTVGPATGGNTFDPRRISIKLRGARDTEASSQGLGVSDLEVGVTEGVVDMREGVVEGELAHG